MEPADRSPDPAQPQQGHGGQENSPEGAPQPEANPPPPAHELCRQIRRCQESEMRISGVARDWRDTFDAMPDLISVHAADYRILRSNRALASHVGCHPRDLVGHTCYQVFHGSDQPWPHCPHRRALACGQTCQIEVEVTPLEVPLRITCTPMFDAEGTAIASVHVAQDISNQREQEAQQAQLIARLQHCLAEVKVLSGLLPICSACKKIRDECGQWTSVETFLSTHSAAEFTHSICPECLVRLYPEHCEREK